MKKQVPSAWETLHAVHHISSSAYWREFESCTTKQESGLPQNGL